MSDQKIIEERVQKIINYIHYSWEDDNKWKQFLITTNWPESKEMQENIRRQYYKDHIDPEIESAFTYKDEEEKEKYKEYYQYSENLGSLLIQKPNQAKSQRYRLIKQILYLVFIIALPLRVPYLGFLYLLAIAFSILERHGRLNLGTNEWAKLFLEEEFMNISILVMMVMSGPKIKLLFNISLFLWAYLQSCELGHSTLLKNPNAPGVAPLRPIIDYGIQRKILIVELKNHLELFIALIAIPLCFIGQAAPIFPVFYSQYIRIKFAINHFTRNSCIKFDTRILQKLIPQPIYQRTITKLKTYLATFVNFEEKNKSKKQLVANKSPNKND